MRCMFQESKSCNREEIGTPCSQCKTYRMRCVDQTPETRKLVLPENRNRRKEIGEKLEDPPCESCWKKSLRCKLNTPGDSRCGHCITRSLVCNWNHPSDPSARFTRGKPKISLDQMCVRCFTRHLTCDGKTPCDKCNTPRLRKKCVSQVE
jgi:hypothetical protein